MPSRISSQLRILKQAIETARPAAQAAYATYLKNRIPVHELNTVRLKKAQGLAPHLLTVPGVRSVHLFGSVARGQDIANSDIDLFVYITGLEENAEKHREPRSPDTTR